MSYYFSRLHGFRFVLLSIVLVLLFLYGWNLLSSNEVSGSEEVSTSVEFEEYGDVPISLSTTVWGIFDPVTGEILSGEGVLQQVPMASITKLFTAAVVLESPLQNSVFTINHTDLEAEGRAGKLVYGETVTPYALLFPLLIESSNDAAEAIRRHMGTAYDTRIAEVIETLELRDTTIYDASGLSRNNVSTVRDLALFYAYMKHTHPHAIDITQVSTYVTADTGYANVNPVQVFETFTGGKNGYTDEAGRTFVGTFRLANTGREMGIVVLQSADLLSDIETLLTYSEAFQNNSDILSK